MKKSVLGFTLVELLVTISIIAILSAIGLVIYSSVIKQGRDSKRQSDLRSIQSALEQYYADQLFYPTESVDGKGLDNQLGKTPPQSFTNAVGNPSLSIGTKVYMNVLPEDPVYKQGSGRYYYWADPSGCDNSTTKCTSYCLYAKLENSNPGIGNCSNTAWNFAVIPP